MVLSLFCYMKTKSLTRKHIKIYFLYYNTHGTIMTLPKMFREQNYFLIYFQCNSLEYAIKNKICNKKV